MPVPKIEYLPARKLWVRNLIGWMRYSNGCWQQLRVLYSGAHACGIRSTALRTDSEAVPIKTDFQHLLQCVFTGVGVATRKLPVRRRPRASRASTSISRSAVVNKYVVPVAFPISCADCSPRYRSRTGRDCSHALCAFRLLPQQLIVISCLRLFGVDFLQQAGRR